MTHHDYWTLTAIKQKVTTLAGVIEMCQHRQHCGQRDLRACLATIVGFKVFLEKNRKYSGFCTINHYVQSRYHICPWCWIIACFVIHMRCVYPSVKHLHVSLVTNTCSLIPLQQKFLVIKWKQVKNVTWSSIAVISSDIAPAPYSGQS